MNLRLLSTGGRVLAVVHVPVGDGAADAVLDDAARALIAPDAAAPPEGRCPRCGRADPESHDREQADQGRGGADGDQEG